MGRVFYGPTYVIPTYTVKVRDEHGCMLTGSPDSVQSQITCYLESRPNGIVDVTYSEHCAQCNGSGRKLASRRTLTWKACKACQGNPEVTHETLIASWRH